MNIDKEFKALIPPLTADEYTGLEQSILAEGCRDVLITWCGTLIDGHNRYEICQKHNIPFKTQEKEFPDRDNAVLWIIDNQLGRRNLPVYERGVLALKKKDIIARQAKENLVRAAKITNNKLHDTPLQKSVNPLHTINAQKELAQMAGTSHDTIYKIEKIEAKAPEPLKEKVKLGEISINQAYQAVRREEKKQAIEQKIEANKEKPTGATDIFTTSKKYNIIYADPPWRYWEGGQKNQSLHYGTMTIDDICKLPVKDIADKDCILFLWVTYPILREAFKVIESWGFEYSTAGFVWIKKNKNADTPFIGCGSWTRANSELCLIAARGNVVRLDASVSQIIESPIEEHSKKPTITRELITRLVGKLPRIELFSRQSVDGWDCWGNEI